MLVAYAECEHVAASEREVRAELEAAVNELRCLALAERVVSSQTVAHLAFALHRCVAESGSHSIVERSEVLGVRCPEFALIDEEVVVVAETVAFLHYSVRMVEVVLCFGRSCGVLVRDNISVDIMELRSAEQVLHSLVVHSLVCGSYHAYVELLIQPM